MRERGDEEKEVLEQEELKKANEMSKREVSALKLLFAAAVVVAAWSGLTMKFKFI